MGAIFHAGGGQVVLAGAEDAGTVHHACISAQLPLASEAVRKVEYVLGPGPAQAQCRGGGAIPRHQEIGAYCGIAQVDGLLAVFVADVQVVDAEGLQVAE
ncbi:MAG: hypothetical protein DI584_18490, partial [Stenotrophomonas sp.]